MLVINTEMNEKLKQCSDNCKDNGDQQFTMERFVQCFVWTDTSILWVVVIVVMDNAYNTAHRCVAKVDRSR